MEENKMSNTGNKSRVNYLAGLLFILLAAVCARPLVGLGQDFIYYIQLYWQNVAWIAIWAVIGLFLINGKQNTHVAILAFLGAAIEYLMYTRSHAEFFLYYGTAYAALGLTAIVAQRKAEGVRILWLFPVLCQVGGMVVQGIPFDLLIRLWARGQHLEYLFEPLALFFAGLWFLLLSLPEKQEDGIYYGTDGKKAGVRGSSAAGARQSGRFSAAQNVRSTRTAAGSSSATQPYTGRKSLSRGLSETERERQIRTYKGLLDADVITREEFELKMKKLSGK